LSKESERVFERADKDLTCMPAHEAYHGDFARLVSSAASIVARNRFDFDTAQFIRPSAAFLEISPMPDSCNPKPAHSL
jgi:hypothetical protein